LIGATSSNALAPSSGYFFSDRDSTPLPEHFESKTCPLLDFHVSQPNNPHLAQPLGPNLLIGVLNVGYYEVKYKGREVYCLSSLPSTHTFQENYYDYSSLISHHNLSTHNYLQKRVIMPSGSNPPLLTQLPPSLTSRRSRAPLQTRKYNCRILKRLYS
jgi:hypothetical protein